MVAAVIKNSGIFDIQIKHRERYERDMIKVPLVVFMKKDKNAQERVVSTEINFDMEGEL